MEGDRDTVGVLIHYSSFNLTLEVSVGVCASSALSILFNPLLSFSLSTPHSHGSYSPWVLQTWRILVYSVCASAKFVVCKLNLWVCALVWSYFSLCPSIGWIYVSSSLSTGLRVSSVRKCWFKQLIFCLIPVSLYRNWTHRPSRHRALQHPRLRRVFVTGTVQRHRPPQVCSENSHTGSGHADSWSVGQTTCRHIAGVLPRETRRIQLWGFASYHPTNVCCNRSLASGQHRWELPSTWGKNKTIWWISFTLHFCS